MLDIARLILTLVHSIIMINVQSSKRGIRCVRNAHHYGAFSVLLSSNDSACAPTKNTISTCFALPCYLVHARTAILVVCVGRIERQRWPEIGVVGVGIELVSNLVLQQPE
jgi:hypothetical protein